MNWKSCCCSVAKLCLTLQPHVLQHARLPCHSPSPGVAQTHVRWVSDANQHVILCHPLLLLPSIFPNIRVFSMSQLFAAASQRIGASTSASVLPMNIQGWFPLGLTGVICLLSKGLSRVFSNTTAILWVSFGGRWQLSSPSELLSFFSFCTIQICMLWSHVLNTGQLPAFCIREYSDDQTHILCGTLRLLTPQTPHFWKCFMTLASASHSETWCGPSWLLMLSALLVIHSGWEKTEKSEVFYVQAVGLMRWWQRSIGISVLLFLLKWGEELEQSAQQGQRARETAFEA